MVLILGFLSAAQCDALAALAALAEEEHRAILGGTMPHVSPLFTEAFMLIMSKSPNLISKWLKAQS